MKIIIDSAIHIYNPTDAVMDFCRNNLVLDNPEYLNRERMGKWTGNTPRYLHLYERIGNQIIVPYGCRKRILALAKDDTVQWADYPEKSYFKADYKSNITPYAYQADVIQSMYNAKNGIIIMPCGSGKTQTALECIDKFGLKTLWLTHTSDLLNQSLERAKMCFDCDADMFGTITAGKVNIGKGITFATIQTMCKIDILRYRTEWAIIVVDECQHCAGTPTRLSQFYSVVNNLYAPYKFGLTATPERSDGLEQSMYALLGGKIAEITKKQVEQITCPVCVEAINSKFIPEPDNILNGDGTINYAKLATELTEDPLRFDYVMAVINERCKSHTIVLANRVQYLKNLQAEYKGRSVCLSSLGTSKKAKEERKKAIKDLNEGRIDCIFATYQLASEGLDCPNLKYIVFATPEKNNRLVTQSVGRVARKSDTKEYGTALDFVDDFGMYQKWWHKRMACYKKLGCIIKK